MFGLQTRPTTTLDLPPLPADLVEADRVVAAAVEVADAAADGSREAARRLDHAEMRGVKPTTLKEQEALRQKAKAAFDRSQEAAAALQAARGARAPLLTAYEAAARGQLQPAIDSAVTTILAKIGEIDALFDTLARLDAEARQRGISLDRRAPASAATARALLAKYVTGIVKAWRP